MPETKRAHKITTRPSHRHVRVEGKDGPSSPRPGTRRSSTRPGCPRGTTSPATTSAPSCSSPTDTTSHCPFKGDATYFSAPGAPDAFWVYEDPSEEAAQPVTGLLAPWPGRVDVIVDGERL